MHGNRLHWIFNRFMAPAGEDGSDNGGGATEDRGDSWTPTNDDDGDGDDAATAAAAKEAAEKKEAAAKEAAEKKEAETAEEKAAKAKAEKGAKKKEGENDEDEDDKDEKDETRKDTRVPLARHKAVLEKERAERAELEKKLAQYQQGDRIAVINDAIKKAEDKILALDKEYTKLMVDGDHEKAAEKRQEIRALETEIVEQKSDMKAQAATARAVEKVRYDTTVERLEAAYPVLNPDDKDNFDAEQAQDVMDLATTYRNKGMTPAEAIQKAAKKLLGAETAKQNKAVDTKARVDEDEVAAEKKRQEKEAERKKAQVAKNLEANKQQPSNTARVGADNDKAGGGVDAKGVLKMSQEDFNKLDDATLSRMRGDTIGA